MSDIAEKVSADFNYPGAETTSRDRREFLQVALLGSASWLLSPQPAEAFAAKPAAKATTARPPHAAFYSLAPGDIRPEGWLRLYLEKQASQLGTHLPEVSWPFSGAYWSGEETPPDSDNAAWWPWEQKAYWIDGALRCALALQDQTSLAASLRALEYTLAHAADDGYLGPAFARDAEFSGTSAGNFRWPHAVFFRALAAYSEATGDERIPKALHRHFLADKGRVRYGGRSRDVVNVETMLWVYERTRDPELLAMAERAWNEFLHSAPPGDRESGDLVPSRVFADTWIHAHGVTYIEKAKLPAILYTHTGNRAYLEYALAAQQRIFSHHMLIDGIPSTTEDYRGTGFRDAHETCDISDHTWSWGYLFMATGDGVWADRIERAVFNAGLGAIKKDWKGLQYFSGPNQLIATSDTTIDFGRHIHGRGCFDFCPNPNHPVAACCGGNVHRFFPNYVIRMWMADSKGGLAALLYGASSVRARVGSKHVPIEITQETGYPFEEEIRFTLHPAAPVTFPLRLRIPGWCDAPQLQLNGEDLPLPPIERGLVRVERLFHPGDRLTLKLPMKVRVSYWPDDAIGIERGPLVYSLAVKENWTSEISPKYSTAEFPDWNATPNSTWNYAIGVRESELFGQIRFQQSAMTADPWVDPPVSLSVPMVKVPNWTLEDNPRMPGSRQTPPLPDLDSLERDFKHGKALAEIEHVDLVPYGATHLRLTVLPKVFVP